MWAAPVTRPGPYGDRGRPIVSRALSFQSRLGNILALILTLSIGAAFFGWYYLHIADRGSRERQRASASLGGKSASETALPPLGKLEFSLPNPSEEAGMSIPASAPADGASIPQASLPVATPTVSAGPVVEPGRATVLERRLSGVAFASNEHGSGSAGISPASLPSERTTAAADPLSALLAAGPASVLTARAMPNRPTLLEKGTFIDCTLETAIDSSLPGLTSCVTATDTFGADGQVVLLERGTKLVGETRGSVQQGSSRVFVLWTEARTPTGVLVPLDSPGADELGRSGLSGQVERHFWQRFGLAVLISTFNGGVQEAVQSTSRGGGTVIYNPSGPGDVTTDVLKEALNIPPTVVKRNGDRIQILVARDVDFSHVYELRRATSRP